MTTKIRPSAQSYEGIFKKSPNKLSERTELQLRIYLCELHDLKKEVQATRYYLGFFAGVTYGEKRYPLQAVELLKAIDSAIQDIKKIKSPDEISKVSQHLQTLNSIAMKWKNSVPELKNATPALVAH